MDERNSFTNAIDIYAQRITGIGMLGTYTGLNEGEEVSQPLILEQNFPNPIRSATTINFAIQKPGFVSIKVYNPIGQEVATLVNGDMKPGKHKVLMSASGLPGGIYSCRLISGGKVITRQMVLVN